MLIAVYMTLIIIGILVFLFLRSVAQDSDEKDKKIRELAGKVSDLEHSQPRREW